MWKITLGNCQYANQADTKLNLQGVERVEDIFKSSFPSSPSHIPHFFSYTPPPFIRAVNFSLFLKGIAEGSLTRFIFYLNYRLYKCISIFASFRLQEATKASKDLMWKKYLSGHKQSINLKQAKILHNFYYIPSTIVLFSNVPYCQHLNVFFPAAFGVAASFLD